MPNIKALPLGSATAMVKVKNFQDEVKGQGKNYMIKIYSTNKKVLSQETLMPNINIKTLPLTIESQLHRLKLTTNRQTG